MPWARLGQLGDRFRRSPRFQHIVARVHAAGVRPVGELLVEMLELRGAGPAVLNNLERWARIDPETIRRLGGDRWPRALDPVPEEDDR